MKNTLLAQHCRVGSVGRSSSASPAVHGARLAWTRLLYVGFVAAGPRCRVDRNAVHRMFIASPSVWWEDLRGDLPDRKDSTRISVRTVCAGGCGSRIASACARQSIRQPLLALSAAGVAEERPAGRLQAPLHLHRIQARRLDEGSRSSGLSRRGHHGLSLQSQAFSCCVLDKDRDEVTYPRTVQTVVLFVNDRRDVLPLERGKSCREPLDHVDCVVAGVCFTHTGIVGPHPWHHKIATPTASSNSLTGVVLAPGRKPRRV